PTADGSGGRRDHARAKEDRPGVRVAPPFFQARGACAVLPLARRSTPALAHPSREAFLPSPSALRPPGSFDPSSRASVGGVESGDVRAGELGLGVAAGAALSSAVPVSGDPTRS